MDRIIEITVKGSYIKKDTKNGGVLGEGNSKYMRIIFDEGWTGLAKKVTFWNAKGQNPVVRTLTADKLTDILVSELDYTIPIPSEPLEFEGEFTYVIDGYEEGKRIRSLADTLEVNYAPMEENAGEPVDPTPTQAEQLQSQIDTLLSDISEQAVIANNAKETAIEHANIATEQAQLAATEVENAKEQVNIATEQANIATNKATEATNAANTAAVKVSEATAQANIATEKANEAAESANSAGISAVSASNSATSAEVSATTASAAVQIVDEKINEVDEKINQIDSNINIATQAAQTATTKANEAKESATNATNAATSASANATKAETAAQEAKNYAEQAGAAVGGDFVTRPELEGFATEEYVDNALANFEGGITEIPVATTDTLGGIKVGEGLEITAEGILSVEGGIHSNIGYTEVDLLTSPATATGTFSLTDSVFNYDEIQVESFIMSVTTPPKEMHKEIARILPSQIKNNTLNEFALSHYTANNSNYIIAYGFTADGLSLAVDSLIKGSNWASRTAGVSRVIGINYDIKVLEGAVNVDNTPTAGSENVVTSGGVKTYVDTQVATKVDATYVNNAVSPKADTTYVDNQISAVNTALANKADTNYVNNRVLIAEQTAAAKAVVKKFTATIPTSGWTSSFPYTVTITVDGMLASDSNFPVSPVYSDTLSTRMAQAEEWGKVTMIAAGNNSIVVTCDEEKPTTAIPIQITVVR